MKRLRNFLMTKFHFLCIISVIAIGVIAIVGSGGGGGGDGDGDTSNPVVTVTSPSDGSSFNEGANINFVGECVDDEDGTLTGSSLVWTSNLDGQIGTGTSCSTSSLSTGTHTITLTATDSDGATGSDSVDITITGACEVTPGEWGGTADFGELSFIVNDTSTGITEITYNWIGFTCGAVTRNGSVAISTTTPWPITDSQFTINNTIDSDFEITLNGTFDDTCTSVSGTWEAVSFGTTCSGTWNASSCDGPVPCLTTDWGDVNREFEEPDGSPILVLSDGAIFAGAGVNDDGHILSLGGTVTDCYNGVIELAGIDLNDDGTLQDPGEYFVASGNAKICDETLTVTNLVIDGVAENDIVATYVGTYTASVYITSEIPPEVLFEAMDKLREDW